MHVKKFGANMKLESRLHHLHESVRKRLQKGPIPELECSAQELRREIIGFHLEPCLMHKFRLPVYDVQVAAFRGLSMSAVIEHAIRILEKPIPRLQREIEWQLSGIDYKVEDYRTDVVKTLMMIAQYNTNKVDWDRVDAAFEDARHLHVFPDNDLTDDSFLADEALPMYRKYA